MLPVHTFLPWIGIFLAHVCVELSVGGGGWVARGVGSLGKCLTRNLGLHDGDGLQNVYLRASTYGPAGMYVCKYVWREGYMLQFAIIMRNA
jgi:hypothetical protein